jgi:hypothetical protein
MRITLDGEEVTEAIIRYISTELGTEISAIDYPTIEVGKKIYDLNFETDVSLWVFKENND